MISAALVGPILGASVGLALWRAAVVAKVVGRVGGGHPGGARRRVGFALGEVMSLGQTGGGNLTGFSIRCGLVVVCSRRRGRDRPVRIAR